MFFRRASDRRARADPKKAEKTFHVERFLRFYFLFKENPRLCRGFRKL